MLADTTDERLQREIAAATQRIAELEEVIAKLEADRDRELTLKRFFLELQGFRDREKYDG